MLEITVQNMAKVVKSLDTIGGWTANTYDWGSIVASEAAVSIRNATDTWTHKPDVQVRKAAGGVGRAQTATLNVRVNSDTYRYVNEGTRAHIIAPKREGGVLAFNSRFRAKSRPNSLRAYKGMSAGPVRFAMVVHHPGFPARNFTKLAFEKARRDGAKIVDAQIKSIIAGRAETLARLGARYG